MTEAQTGTTAHSVPEFLRSSSLPYLATLIVGITGARYLQYLWQYFLPGLPVIKGQSPGIWASFVTIAVAGVLWLVYRGRRPGSTALNWFFGLLLVAWAAGFVLLRIHQDAHDYTVWLYPIVVAMLWLKAPNLHDTRASLLVLGWSATAILAGTRVAELLGVLPMAPVPPKLVEFEVGEYWLPLSGWLGPEGRWPGPLNGTAFTGMMGALLLVLAVALLSRSSWVFGIVGIVTVLLTSSRGAFAAAAVGIAVALLFSDARWLRWLSMRWRLVLGVVGTLGTFGVLLKAAPGLTGRTDFWPDFLALWTSSPFIGVGATGLDSGTAATSSAKSAHNLVIDELARNGLLGLVLLLAALGVGLYLAVRPALRRFGGPLAMVATFLTLGIANTPTSWNSPSTMWLFLVLPIAWAGAWLTEPSSPNLEQGPDRLALEPVE